ncbi:type VI secretion system-associated protein VasI [Pseudoxanthomonas putridarboris]|uniref:Type VI secretion system-associated protein VasI n=1 Tax=Pseudoxanthomonas putridarboris TaxID=752605 RepID=A0ABU9J524_9GAMM
MKLSHTLARTSALMVVFAIPVIAAEPVATLSHCTGISSALQRLECFDKAAGTPLTTIQANVPAIRRRVPDIVLAVAAHEKSRPVGDMRFRMVESEDRTTPGQRRVLISAPAINRQAPRPLLTISCIANITRLQFILHPPVGRNQVNVALSIDGRPVVPRQTWQVLEDGTLVDAGRGLAGIDVVRRLGSGNHLEVSSDLPQLDGLRFDAQGLGGLIDVQRKACGW